MNLFAGQERDTDTEKGFAGGGEGGTNWESNTDTHTLPRVEQMAGGKRLCNTGSSAWYSDTLQGWGGKGEGGSRWREYIYVCVCVYNYGWFALLYGRNQHNTVKQLSSNLKIN